MPDEPTIHHHERAAVTRARAADAGKANLALRREAEELRQRTAVVAQQLQAARSALADKRFRLAALNLLEDAEEARRRTILEVEERKRAEESLHASEQRLQAALTAGRMATWDWEPQTDTITGSETINELFGLKSGQLLRSTTQLFKLLHPEDLPAHREVVENAARIGGGWHQEFRIVRPRDGGVAWLEERAHALSDPGRGKVLFSGVVWDISERKRAEEALRQNEARMRLILESALEYAIFSLDLQRRVTMWSAGAERLLGFNQNEIIGQSADRIFIEEDRARGAPDYEVETARREGRAADERWHLRKSGERFWASGVLMAMRAPDGRLFGFVKILRDHTEAKRHEQAMGSVMGQLEHALAEAQQARKDAEEANRAKDTFLAALSHELRTPLTPVLMTAESLLRRKDVPTRVRDGLQMICRNIELETHFINDLLDLTRISRGKFELLREPLDLHDAIRRAVEICEADIRAKKQKLTLRLAAAQPCVLGDLPRLQQVFWNVLKNASKFTPENGEIQITSRNDAESIVVAVRDSGIGIEPAELKEVFEAFRQANTEITRKYGGLGLGLAISQATVQHLGGEIFAESDGPGRGATLTVRLPNYSGG